jgi:hypothetical protein
MVYIKREWISWEEFNRRMNAGKFQEGEYIKSTECIFSSDKKHKWRKRWVCDHCGKVKQNVRRISRRDKNDR